MRLAGIRAIYPALNIIEAASEGNGGDYEELGVVYFILAERLSLNWLREEINTYPVGSRWDVLARAALKADLDQQQRRLTLAVMELRSKTKAAIGVDIWFTKHSQLIGRWQLMLADLRSRPKIEFTMLSVAVRELARLAGSGG
jgi:glutamate dehydrogenase